MDNFVVPSYKYILERFPIPQFILNYIASRSSDNNKSIKPVHLYPTPRPINRNNRESASKHIVINSENTNPFNNATFFIILQISILIYFPASSCLAPYYEDGHNNDYLLKNERICSNQYEYDEYTQITPSFQEFEFIANEGTFYRINQEIDEEFELLRSKIDYYGHLLFPTLAAQH